MDVSCALGGVHNAPTDSDHQNEGDDDKLALISKVRMVNSEVCHGMVLSASALRMGTSIRPTSSPIYCKVNPVFATCFSFKKHQSLHVVLKKNMFVHFDKNWFLMTKM